MVNYGQKLVVNKLDAQVGDTVTLKLIVGFGGDDGAKKVTAKVLAHQKGAKIRVVKYKEKSNYHRQYGPRQYETVLEVLGANGEEVKSEKVKVKSETATVKEVKEMLKAKAPTKAAKPAAKKVAEPKTVKKTATKAKK
jgi:large subunit ribosomal protein L21